MDNAPPPSSPRVASRLSFLKDLHISSASLKDDATLSYQIASVGVRHDHLSSLPRVLEALQLLAELAQRDTREWERCVAWLWPPDRLSVLRRAAGANVIGLVISVDPEQAEALCQQLVKSVRNAASDEEVPALVQVPVRIALHDGCALAVSAALTAVAAVVSQRCEHTASRFCIKSVWLTCATASDAELLLPQLAMLAERGVRINQLPKLDIRDANRRAATIASSLQRLLATRSSRRHLDGAPRVDAPPLIEYVRFPFRRYDPAHSALLSAIGDSTNVREIFMYFVLPDIREWSHHEHHWLHGAPVDQTNPTEPTVAQWLAFSLFSRASRHCIQGFSLHTECHGYTLPHRQICEVLAADDPVAGLFPQDAESIAQFSTQRLAASKFVLLDPVGINSGDKANTDAMQRWSQPHVGLRILREAPEWWCALLPTWGRAWVRREDATVTSVDLAEDSVPNHWIRQIQLTLHSTMELAQTLSWLAFAGCGVKKVSISQSYLTHTDSIYMQLDVQDAQSAFPNAKTLELSRVRVRSLRQLAELIGRDRWPIEHLSLFKVLVREADEGVASFLTLLADDLHPMSRMLQSLTLNVTDSDGPQAEIVTAALRMLTINRTLCSFNVVVSPRRNAESPWNTEEVRAAFVAQHDTPCRSPLLREQLAILSAASHCNRAPLGRVLQRCDRPVFASIFAFAGLVARRSVKLTVY